MLCSPSAAAYTAHADDSLSWMQEEEDENVEENEEYQEGKLRFAGGRKEEATYDAGDEEDKQIAASARREAERQGGQGEVGNMQLPPADMSGILI